MSLQRTSSSTQTRPPLYAGFAPLLALTASILCGSQAGAAARELPAGYEFITDADFLRLDSNYIRRMEELVVKTPNEHRSEVILRLLSSGFGAQYLAMSGKEITPAERLKLFAPLLEASTLKNPFVERLLRRMVAGAYIETLKPDKAKAALAPLGYLRHWFGVVVPAGGAAPEVQTIVDRDPSIDRKYFLGWRNLGWQPLDTGAPVPGIDTVRLSGAKGDITYLQNQFFLEDPFEGFLLLETPSYSRLPAMLVFADGVRVKSLIPAEQAVHSEVYVPIDLEKGWHRLVLKVLRPIPPEMKCSLVDKSGRPVRVKEETSAVPHEPAGARTTNLPHPNDALTFYSRQDGLTGEEAGLAALTRAMLYSFLHDGEAAFYEAQKALSKIPDFPPALLIAALTSYSYDGLPESERRGKRAGYLEKILSLDPGAVIATHLLAQHYAEEDKIHKAFEMVSEGLELAPASLALHLSMLNLIYAAEQRIGSSPSASSSGNSAIIGEKFWFDRALKEVRAIEALAPGQEVAVNARCRFLRKRGLEAKARDVFAAYASRNPSASNLSALAHNYYVTGEMEKAVRLGRQLEDAGVGSFPRPDRWLTRLLQQAGKYEEAAARLEETAKVMPLDPSIRKRLGQCYENLGMKEKALAAFKQALALAPGDTNLRRYVEEMEGAEPFYEKYRVPLGKHKTLKELKDANEDADTARLIDHMVVRVHEDGSSEYYLHEAVMVLTTKGVEKVKDQSLPGDRILTVRTVLPDGETFEPNLKISSGKATMSHLVPGAVVEYEVVGAKNRSWSSDGTFDLDAWYFQDPDFAEPFLFSGYVLEIHKNAAKRAVIHKYRFDGISDPEPGSNGDYLVYKWTVRDMPRRRREPLSPAPSRILPAVHVQSRGTWERLAAAIAFPPASSDVRATRLIRETAAEVLKKAGLSFDSGRKEKADALYEFVCKEIETDGSERNAEEVLRSRSGNRTALLAALLAAAGVPVYTAMIIPPEPVMTMKEEPFDWFSPRRLWTKTAVIMLENGFPYKIAIPGRFGRYSPPGLFKPENAGGMCLVSMNGKGLLVPIPNFRRKRWNQTLLSEVVVKPDASVEGRFNLRLDATERNSSVLKYLFHEAPAAMKKLRVQQITASLIRGGETTGEWSVSGQAPSEPFELKAEFRSSHLFTRTSEGLVLKGSGLSPLNLVSSLIGNIERTTPMIFPLNTSELSSMTIRFDPEKIKVGRLPAGKSLALPFATYNFSVTASPGEIKVKRSYNFTQGVIPPEEYDDLVRFCRGVDAVEEQVLRLVPVKK